MRHLQQQLVALNASVIFNTAALAAFGAETITLPAPDPYEQM
jgi:hypothetical protein